METLNIAFLNI